MTNLQDFVYQGLDRHDLRGLSVGGCIFPDIDSLADRIIEYHSKSEPARLERVMRFRRIVSESARAYLERQTAGGLRTPETVSDLLRDKIHALSNKDPKDLIVLLSAHQPNLFPYSGVSKKVALLVALSKKIEEKTDRAREPVCLFAFADHDFVHNKWIRSAELPAPLRREGVLRYNVKVPQKDIMLPANKISKPPKDTVEQWKQQTSSWVSENIAMARKLLQSVPHATENKGQPNELSRLVAANGLEFWRLVDGAYSCAETLSAFNAGVLSNMVHEFWEQPVLFANFSECFGFLGEEYSWMIENADAFSEVIRSNEGVMKRSGLDSGLAEDVSDVSPVWLRCSCGSKYRLVLEHGAVSGRCVRCGSDCSYTSSQLKSLAETSPHQFEPRSIAMPIALSLALDMSCYVGGIGGLGYLMHSRAIAEKFGVRFPPTPFWYVEDRYESIELLCSAFGVLRLRNTYAASGKTKPQSESTMPEAESVAREASSLFSILERSLSTGEIQRNAVSERDKLLLANIAASLKINGCLIDGALNVGIKSTLEQWLEFLSKDGRLNVPIRMRASFEKDQGKT